MMVRRRIGRALILLLVALGACSKERGTYRGVVVLDRSTARPIVATWATSKATESTDPGDPLADLYEPVDVAIGPGDSIYVADMGSGRIIVYSPEGRPARTIGRFGQGPGEFEHLRTVTIDGEGRIWAGEMGRLQVLSADGECLALSTLARFFPLSPVLAALPDGRVWAGGSFLRLVQEEDGWAIASADNVVDLLAHDPAKTLKAQKRLRVLDVISQLGVRSSHGYVLLAHLVTARKPYAWLQEFDQNGVLKSVFDVDPACTDSNYIATKRMLGDDGYMPAFRRLLIDQRGDAVLVTADPPLLCRFDPLRCAFADVSEIHFRSSDNGMQRLPTAWSAAVDSQGRIVVTGITKSLKRVVMQLPWQEGGDVS
ncbi:hypothetical protein JXA88_12880 [Candidatus Fermentibacteria bacterium]|nr:hypothetical protein [Candidatus Fermentibacteria bacterium]